MVISSHKSTAEWAPLFGDETLTAAILDRLLHHSHAINIRGESYRFKDKLQQVSVNAADLPLADDATTLPAHPERAYHAAGGGRQLAGKRVAALKTGLD